MRHVDFKFDIYKIRVCLHIHVSCNFESLLRTDDLSPTLLQPAAQMDKISKSLSNDESIVEAPVTVVDVDDGDNYDDAYEDGEEFVEEDDNERVCRCEGPCPHKE